MVWIVGAICMIFFGAILVVIGLSVTALGYAIVGGILALAGIFLLVSMRRTWRERNMPPLR
jgi:threonine/homoserine/homoserine lactone efflux protein